jgi:hypothetical protein
VLGGVGDGWRVAMSTAGNERGLSLRSPGRFCAAADRLLELHRRTPDAPAAAGDVSDEIRRLSLAAMTNLMCRGRKRGLAGVIATQRLAKLAKNVAAEASNFLNARLRGRPFAEAKREMTQELEIARQALAVARVA